MSAADDFNQTIQQERMANQHFLAGDAAPVKALWSHADDVTICGGWGAYEKGWEQVGPRLDWAAARFGEGHTTSEMLTMGMSGDLAYTVWIDRGQARVAGRDEFSPMALRVTYLFRREDGGKSDPPTVAFARAEPLPTTSRKEQSMTIRRELIDELLKEYETPQDILGEGGLLKELTKAVIERCLETELDSHLGYPKHVRKGNALGNTHNGSSQKPLTGEQGHVDIEVPRDRQGTFEPQLVKKGQTRLDGFDDKILALYARGMTTRDIQAQLQERDARGSLAHLDARM